MALASLAQRSPSLPPCSSFMSLMSSSLRAPPSLTTTDPAMASPLPLKSFVRDVQMTSATPLLRRSTLAKLPMVSSTIRRKLYSSARDRSLRRSGMLRRGFEGNSVIRHVIPASLVLLAAALLFRRNLRVFKSLASPNPKNSTPSLSSFLPHILSVSRYGNPKTTAAPPGLCCSCLRALESLRAACMACIPLGHRKTFEGGCPVTEPILPLSSSKASLASSCPGSCAWNLQNSISSPLSPNLLVMRSKATPSSWRAAEARRDDTISPVCCQ
mmetsp:Transcript_11653/g.23200  ORF Transcript_11653/g.23200 Transcript_11653/m.23200 type:complete len:271 (+) Transcript_11653:603-1415(+)